MIYNFRIYDVLQSKNGPAERPWLDFQTLKDESDAEIAASLVETGLWEGQELEFRIVRYVNGKGSLPIYECKYTKLGVLLQPITFGDLLSTRFRHFSCRCSFCKRDEQDEHYTGARSYSTRHYICDECIEARRDKKLPSVLRHERFERRWAQSRGGTQQQLDAERDAEIGESLARSRDRVRVSGDPDFSEEPAEPSDDVPEWKREGAQCG